jgi:dynein heavy chain
MPIVLISSSDHTLPFLQQFADSRGISVMHMAIGRGQGAATDRLIRAAVGEWRDVAGGPWKGA